MNYVLGHYNSNEIRQMHNEHLVLSALISVELMSLSIYSET